MIRLGRRLPLFVTGCAIIAGIAWSWGPASAQGLLARGPFRLPKSLQGAKPSSQDEAPGNKMPQTPAEAGVPPSPPASREAYTQEANAGGKDRDQKVEPLIQLVDKAIYQNTRRYLDVTPGNSQQNSPWQIMHGILAFRNEYLLKQNTPTGIKKVRAIEYISDRAMYRNEYWFEATPYGGRAHPFNVPYWFEGHVNQFLAILTMSNLPLNHEFKVADGKVITMADMVRHAMKTTNSNEEVSWTLWFLGHYLDPDEEWTNIRGQKWSLGSLVQIQTADGVYDAPCGGCHGLFALSYARNSYLQKHGDLRGVWLDAHQKIEKHIQLAQQIQNSDGSFSTKFFRQREFSFDFAERIKCSGHMLEWLMMGLPQRRLNEPWVQAAVRSLATDLTSTVNQAIDPGPLYHACHALAMYRQRAVPAVPAPIAQPTLQPLPEVKKPVQTAEIPTKPISSAAPFVLPEPTKPAPIAIKPMPAPTVPVAIVPLKPATEPAPKPKLEPVVEEPLIPPPPPLPVQVGEKDNTPILVPIAPEEEKGAPKRLKVEPVGRATVPKTLVAPPMGLKPVEEKNRPLLVPPAPIDPTGGTAPKPEPVETPPAPPTVD
jgi:hypothetical protein